MFHKRFFGPMEVPLGLHFAGRSPLFPDALAGGGGWINVPPDIRRRRLPRLPKTFLISGTAFLNLVLQ
jgi:hypothetical protein